ncbi:MAG: tetratricopeptide repeat protein [Phycisphaeraceae bacterium]|nr:tetratricopeptide repeat protein [Phycisphaeraceae bacterium]
MAEDKNPNASAQTTGSSTPIASPSAGGQGVRWRLVWPLPVLAVGLGLLVGGLTIAVKSRPKPDPSRPLARAVALAESRKYEECIELLNTQVKRFIDAGEAGGVRPEHLRDYHLTVARSFSGAQELLGFNRSENHRVVVDNYRAAQSHEAVLLEGDVFRLVASLLALDRIDEALTVVRSADFSRKEPGEGGVGAGSGQARIRLFRQIVEHNMRSSSPRDGVTLELLGELQLEPELSPVDRAWVVARQAELLLSAGRAEDAIVKLLPRIRIGERASAEVNAELHALLGRAYFEAGQFDAAMRQLEVASESLDPLDPARAPVEVMIGRIMQTVGDLPGARARFLHVVSEQSTTESYLPALLGLAEVEGAVIGAGYPEEASADLESSIRRYAEVVDRVRTRPPPSRWGVTRERVASSLLDRAVDREQAEDLASSLRFAKLAESLYRDHEVPTDVHSMLARVHRRMGELQLSAAKGREGVDFSFARLNPIERTEIKSHFLLAAEHSKAFASKVSASDQEGYADAMWMAADSYDQAGDLESAKREFGAYADSAADADPRKQEARFRLAQTFMALGDFGSAAALFRSLREGGTMKGSGPWGDLSVVPLARCLLRDDSSDNDDEAENLLLSVVDGSVVAPESPTFRDALVELGRLYYSTGRHAAAVGRLRELVRRYPDEMAIEHWRFWLADSLRLSAAGIAASLDQSLPHAERAQLAEARAERLSEAMGKYREVRTALEARPATSLTELDRLYIRNAYFYEGDCAFDLGDFDLAVRAYDSARQRYAEEPASLVAMVQIVNAYVAQERWAEARTANERAAHHLERFPESVWARSDLPMERRHWERWLDARTLLDRREHESASAGEERP